MNKHKENFDKLVNRINRAYGCFLLWKCIRVSISIPDSGKQEAERRRNIMNRYDGIFTGVLYAVENAFITDLHKFFDKSKDNLRLETLTKNLSQSDQAEIVSLTKSVKEEVERIRILRHNFTAHEPKNPKEEKIFVQEIEKVFLAVQQILNIVSRSVGGAFMIWDEWKDNTNQSFSCLLNDLECGAARSSDSAQST